MALMMIVVMVGVASAREAEALCVRHKRLTVVPLRTITRASAQFARLLHLMQDGQRVVAALRALETLEEFATVMPVEVQCGQAGRVGRADELG